jgi:hypothetical protein
MDLALELGMTVDALSRSMTERELGRWAKYARQQMLPTRRVERYLAQIAFAVVKTIPGSKAQSLTDFLISFVPQPIKAAPLKAEDLAHTMDAIAGGKGVYVLGARRRAREAARNGTR